MYNKSKKTKQVLELREYAKYVAQLSKIVDNYPEGEGRIIAIGDFLRVLPEEESRVNNLITLCREYCSLEMNEVCFTQEILKEKNEIEKQKRLIKEEIRMLTQILKELDKITTTKKFTMEKRREMMEVVRGKNFKEFKEELCEIKRNIKMTATTEITVEEANQFFQIVLSHLKTLSKFLK